MPKCFFCDHNNPEGMQECQECGAELQHPEQTAQPSIPDPQPEQESAADPFEEELLQHLRAGRKIAAVKVYRQQTAVGLKEAVDAVEALARKHNLKTIKTGCSTSAAVLAMFVAMGLWWILS